ncbi:MAG: hypothetical protein IJ316_05030 [Clostridia bacterium]|nr:hypothetical protein [Clostridia bacterium]
MKILLVFLSAVIVLSLSACGCGKNVEKSQIEPAIEPVTENEEVQAYREMYAQAKENGDYVGMNNAQSALKNQDFDYTHDGVISQYDYAYTNPEGKEIKGMVYFLDLPNEFSFAEAEEVADRQSIGENDYVVIDYTHLKDARLQVRNSYRADNYYVRDCIIDVLLQYDNENNTPWQRTKETMEIEWYVHNLSYAAGYKTERAKHVDLNNEDENVY